MSSSAPARVCLHLVVTSSSDALEACLAHFRQGDTVLFIDEGVVWLATKPGARFDSLLTNAFFSGEDLDARGLAEIANQAGVNTVKDSDFPALLLRYTLCLTWK